MKKKKDICLGLVGHWASADPLQEDVVHHISVSRGDYKVSVTDAYDGEKAEVYDLQWDGERLRYKLHWRCTGRFSENSLIFLQKGKAGLCFRYSDHEILVKKQRARPMKTRKA